MRTVDPLAEILSVPPLRDQLWRRFDEQPSLPALHVHDPHVPGGGRWLTYEQLGRAVNRTAHAFAAAGAAPGVRVGVMLPNGEMFVRAWLALVALNATMMPVNPGLVGTSLRHIVLNADLDLLLCSASLLQTVRDACGGAPPARQVLVVNLTPRPRPLWQVGGGVQDFGTLLDVALETAPPMVPVDHADLALIIYTSGTTGPAKGVMLSRLASSGTVSTTCATSSSLGRVRPGTRRCRSSMFRRRDSPSAVCSGARRWRWTTASTPSRSGMPCATTAPRHSITWAR